MEANNQYIASGTPISEAKHALIMIHGRGASAESIVALAPHLKLPGQTAILAPRAAHQQWYPERFTAPEESNQPFLDQSLAQLSGLLANLVHLGIPTKEIYFLGFSQGACLALEFVARNAAPYGGVVAFTGGLIGEEMQVERYHGDFEQTPILISTSNPDHHVPLKRVKDSGCQLERMNAKVNVIAFPGKPHNITNEEIELANKLIFYTS